MVPSVASSLPLIPMATRSPFIRRGADHSARLPKRSSGRSLLTVAARHGRRFFPANLLGIVIGTAASPAMAQTFQNNDFITWSQVACTGDLTFANGLTVRQILNDANTVLGGGPEPNPSVMFQDMFYPGEQHRYVNL